MSNHKAAYAVLADELSAKGIDVEQVKTALKHQHIETPSWGYANSGTRFRVYPWAGAATTTRQKLDDAAMVNQLTGVAPSVAVHIPWDIPEDNDFVAMKQYAEAKGISIGAVNPNYFQDDEYRLGSFGNPDPAIQERALDHTIECCEIMRKTGSTLLSLWYADGTNFAGQDNIVGRMRRFERNFAEVYKHLPAGSRMAIEYKFFEPSFYNTDIPDWGTAYMMSLRLGDQAQVLVDLGHHAHGVNIEQIVAVLLAEGKLGGFHFNNRKYADDDLIVGSVNPYELFLIYHELVSAELGDDPVASKASKNVAYMLDQCHNIEGKLAATLQSVINCQESYAKALLVQRKQLAELQATGAVLEAHNLLNDAFRTDVRPLLAQVREEMGVPIDPIAAYKKSGYEEKIRKERGRASASGGFQ
ncbi:MAG: L-rhamnose isomerase [Anaerolineales bacterium]|nr:L-rhamnose isomerase [Anaerolineales bacterium]